MRQPRTTGCLMRIQNRMSHPHSFNLRLVLIALLTVSLLPSIAPAAPTPVSFSKDVWPLLESSCISCHGPEKQRGGLRLDPKADALRGGDDGPVIVPGRRRREPARPARAGLKTRTASCPPKGAG